jgi:hypothetical protein
MTARLGSLALAAPLALALLTAPQAARADFEAWSPFEVRVPLVSASAPSWPRLDLRLVGEARFATRLQGASTLFLRVGPVLYLTPWLFVAAHGTILSDALSTTAGMPTRMEEEARAELEPTFFGRIGPLTLVHRNRAEFRWRQTFQRVRLRTQLRVNLAPQGWRVMPFVQDELLFDTWDSRDPTAAGVAPTPGLNQNRTMLGVGLQVADHVRLDLALLLRARQQPGMTDWALDVGPWIQLFVDVPKRAQSATGQSATGQSATGQSATGTAGTR